LYVLLDGWLKKLVSSKRKRKALFDPTGVQCLRSFFGVVVMLMIQLNRLLSVSSRCVLNSSLCDTVTATDIGSHPKHVLLRKKTCLCACEEWRGTRVHIVMGGFVYVCAWKRRTHQRFEQKRMWQQARIPKEQSCI
jgi:hypothetical protein